MNKDKNLSEKDLNKLIEYFDSIYQSFESLLNNKEKTVAEQKFDYLYKDENLHEIGIIKKILDMKDFFDLIKDKNTSSNLQIEGIIALYVKVNQLDNLKNNQLNKFKSNKELLEKIQKEKNIYKDIFNNLDKSLKIFNLKEKEIKDRLAKEEIDQQNLIQSNKQKKLNEIERN